MWRLGIHEKNTLTISKSIYRDLHRILTPKYPLIRSSESENTHILYPEPSHSGEICSSKDCNTILRYLYFWWSFYILKSKMTMFSCVKNTYFKLFIWSCRTLYHTIFNVIFILKNPDIISPSIYRDILTQRTHSKSSKSVPPTLNHHSTE